MGRVTARMEVGKILEIFKKTPAFMDIYPVENPPFFDRYQPRLDSQKKHIKNFCEGDLSLARGKPGLFSLIRTSMYQEKGENISNLVFFFFFILFL